MKMTGLRLALGAFALSPRDGLSWFRLAGTPSPTLEVNRRNLKVGETLRAYGPLTVECIAGRVWVTQAGTAQDVILRAGETQRFTGAGLVVMEALASAKVIIHAI